MFGMEKQPKAPFEFALEEDLKGQPNKKKLLLEEVDSSIQEIKSTLRNGANTEDFDDLGVLLHGYSALQKVVQKIAVKK